MRRRRRLGLVVCRKFCPCSWRCAARRGVECLGERSRKKRGCRLCVAGEVRRRAKARRGSLALGSSGSGSRRARRDVAEAALMVVAVVTVALEKEFGGAFRPGSRNAFWPRRATLLDRCGGHCALPASCGFPFPFLGRSGRLPNLVKPVFCLPIDPEWLLLPATTTI